MFELKCGKDLMLCEREGAEAECNCWRGKKAEDWTKKKKKAMRQEEVHREKAGWTRLGGCGWRNVVYLHTSNVISQEAGTIKEAVCVCVCVSYD